MTGSVRTWVWLGAAIVAEVTGTLALRAAVDHAGWYALVVPAYVGAFASLAAVLRAGMPLGVAYGIWAAAGVALTAVAGRVLFCESLSRRAVLGIVLIVVGVLLIELGAAT